MTELETGKTYSFSSPLPEGVGVAVPSSSTFSSCELLVLIVLLGLIGTPGREGVGGCVKEEGREGRYVRCEGDGKG